MKKIVTLIKEDLKKGFNLHKLSFKYGNAAVMMYLESLKPKEKDTIKCPSCGEEENLHINYDYNKPEHPIINILCNECGTFFELNKK